MGEKKERLLHKTWLQYVDISYHIMLHYYSQEVEDMRAYQKYMKVFGVKGFEHPEEEFVTKKGVRVILTWVKNEYRAFKKYPDGHISEMLLGSTSSKNLKEHIMRNY